MKLRPFELSLVIVFAVLAVSALVMLRGYEPSGSSSDDPLGAIGSVTIWGTFPAEGVNQVLKELTEENEAYENVSYSYSHPSDFDAKLLGALADGVGPDLIMTSQEKLIEMRRRIQPLSKESFPEVDFRKMYLDGTQIFYMSDGLYGLPIAVDPLMMYWNKDILSNEGYLDAPLTWENLVNVMFPDLIDRDFDRTINRSVVAMGEYANIRNAFGTISALMIQSGSEGVVEDGKGGYSVRLQSSSGSGSDPLFAAANFYTRFSKTSNTLYSWNRSIKEDRLQFVSEDLVFYFGYGSEGVKIERMNPNLNFDIAEIPQGAAASVRRTYGKLYAMSLLRSSDNMSGATSLMYSLGGEALASRIAVANNMVPAHRGSAGAGSNDNYGRMAFKSSLVTYGWLNPNLAESDEIFETMTRDINENRRGVSSAANDVSGRLKNEY